MVELPLVGTHTTDGHATVFTAGNRGAVGQRDSRVAAVPADHEVAGPTGAVLETTSQQGTFLVSGMESVPVSGPAGGQIRYPRSQTRTVRSSRSIATGDIRRPGDPLDERDQSRR